MENNLALVISWLLISRIHSSTSGVRLKPIERSLTPHPTNFTRRKLRKRKERKRLLATSQAQQKVIEPMKLFRKHAHEDFTDASSNDEGFGSEATYTTRVQHQSLYISTLPTMIEEEEEGIPVEQYDHRSQADGKQEKYGNIADQEKIDSNSEQMEDQNQRLNEEHDTRLKNSSKVKYNALTKFLQPFVSNLFSTFPDINFLFRLNLWFIKPSQMLYKNHQKKQKSGFKICCNENESIFSIEFTITYFTYHFAKSNCRVGK